MSLAPNHMRQQTKRREIYHALGVVDDCKGSLGWAVQCLKKEDPQKWFGLTTSTLSTWYSRYPPKSAARERLMLVNPDGYRDRKDKYAKIKKALKAEVERREELSLMRDRDTMIEWMKVRAKEYADAGDSLYRGFKASVGFFYDTIREEGISLCTEVGKQENPWNGYVIKRGKWVKVERVWMSENGYVESGYIAMKLVDNLDEVPVTLKGRARKQLNASSKKECKALAVPVTFDASKRFCTWTPICGYTKMHGIYVNLRGSPRQSEKNKYPSSIGYNTTSKAWMTGDGWLGVAKYYKKRTRRASHSKKRVAYGDWYGVHVKNQDRFAELSTNHFRLFIKGETHNSCV